MPKPNRLTMTDPNFQKLCVERIEPAVLRDMEDMIRGRVAWRNISSASEVLGRSMSFIATVLAYSSSSELTAGTVSRALAFASGACGTVGIVAILFAQFSRTQSMERTDAVNTILAASHLQKIPDIMHDIEIQGQAD